MRRLFWHWAISAIALVLAVKVVPYVELNQWYNAIWIAPLLGLVNVGVGIVTGVFTVFFGLANLLTLGLLGFLFSFILYGLAIWWLGHTTRPAGPLAEFLPVTKVLGAIMLGVVMGLFSVLLNMLLPGRKDRRR